MNVDVDLSEVDALVADLAVAGARAAVGSRVIVAKTASELRGWAQADAPVRTGELRGSIYARDGVVGSDVRQGFFQEFGTSVMSPQPWLFRNGDRAGDLLVVGLEQLGDPL